jgi:hypothetical protein
MYLGSKYEDIYPLHSRTVAEKIAHKAFTQAQVTRKEGEILKLFEFGIDFVTPYDLYQTFTTLVTARASGPT